MEKIENVKEYVEAIRFIREYLPGYVAPHETRILRLTVREYFEFRKIFKHEYIYFGYHRERVAIAAKALFLQFYGY